ncbi:hypothetical protein Tco_0084426 [Tanacetum coccineum]
MEEELYNLSVKGNDLKPYVRRFQELTTLCPNMVPNNEKLLEAFIGGYLEALKETLLPRNLKLWRKPSTYPRVAQRIPSTQILPESREILLTVTKRYDLENK